MKSIKVVEKEYELAQKAERERIKAIPNKSKRFWRWVLYFLVFPFKWMWVNFRDWRTILIFLIVIAVVGSEVWIPFILGLIFNNGWLLGIAATCEAFWLAPFTPFLPLCIVITIGIKALFNRVKNKNVTQISTQMSPKDEKSPINSDNLL